MPPGKPEPMDRQYTALSPKDKPYQYCRLPQQLVNAPKICNHAIRTTLQPVEDICRNYQDVVVVGGSERCCRVNLDKVRNIPSQSGWTVPPGKTTPPAPPPAAPHRKD
eukprot:GHVO01018205.1.p4 GENE.GHVO01018205.1~~GHVO01018205.1.p4  ORF type:complete len:108 (+),score=8.34 GHVO01018205.1:732-1055(+)